MSTEQITIRLPVERVAALKKAARAGTRSLAQQVEHLLKHTEDLVAQNALLLDENSRRSDRCAELDAELVAVRQLLDQVADERDQCIRAKAGNGLGLASTTERTV